MQTRSTAWSVFAICLALLASNVGAAEPDEGTGGIRVRSCNLLAVEGKPEADQSGGNPASIAIFGARNGWFSGKVIVSSGAPLEGLKAAPTELACGDGTIAADALRIRYGRPWEGMPGWYCPVGFDILEDSPPQGRSSVSVWVTVRIPADASPGVYTGRLDVGATGADTVQVPVRVEVAGWTLPDTQDYRTWIELVQSPDTLAVEYGVPLWSDEHWAMIARSFDAMGEIGSRVVYVPLICHTNLGNEQSMVRWTSKDGEHFEHDFSLMERYLDLAEQHMGRPKIVVFNAWDVYLKPPDKEPEELPEERRGHDYFEHVKAMAEARWALRGQGPAVTLLDPDTQETTTLHLPRYEDPAGADLWQPVWAELRERMHKRGLKDAMMIGMSTDMWPSKEEVVALDGITGGLPWVSHTHGGSHVQPNMYGVADVGYTTYVWNLLVTLNPARERTYGWQRPDLIATHYRLNAINHMLPSRVKGLLETNVTGSQRGVGRIGGDFWWAVKDKRGRRAGTVNGRYLESQWRNLDILNSVMAPGADGPVTTARYEFLREGLEECEARILIERVLTDDALRASLPEGLAERCQTLLDERQRCLWRGRGLSDDVIREHGSLGHYWRTLKIDEDAGHAWFLNSGWQERAKGLFDLAGEVAAALGR